MNDANKTKEQLIAELRALRADNTHLASSLEKLEEKHRIFYENSPIPMFITSIDDGRILDTNKSGVDWSGYSSEEELLKEFVPGEQYSDPNRRKEVLNTLKNKGDIHKKEYKFVRKNGTPVWVEYYARVYPDKGWIASTMVDITKRKHAEDKLRSSEERFDLAIKGSGTGLWDWNVQTNEAYWSPQCKALFGYQDHKIESSFKTWTSFLHPDDKKRVLDALREHIDNHIPFDEDYRIKTGEGNYKWFNSRGQALWNTEGKATRMVGSIRDITDHKLAEKNLISREKQIRESRDFLKNIFATSMDGIIVTDLQGTITMLNAATENISGYSQDELLGEYIAILSPPEPTIRSEAEEEIERFIKSGREHGRESVWQRKNGQLIYIESNKSLIKDTDGQIAGAMATVRDITKRKELEVSLKKAHQELEKKVKERTATLQATNERLEKEINKRGQIEKGLRESEERYRTLIETIPHGIQEIDTSGITTFANNAYNKLYDYGEGEAVGTSVLDKLTHDYERENLRNYLITVAEDQPAPTPYFANTLTKKGNSIDIRIDWNYKRDEKGSVVGFVSVVTDITQQKQAEESLLASQEQARAILNAPFDTFFIVDRKGTIIDFNESFLQRFNKSADEVNDSSIWDLLPPELIQSRQAVGNKVFQTGNPIRFQDHRQDIWLDNTVYPVLDKHGKTTAIAVFSRDITETRHAHEDLRKTRDFLENIIESSLDSIVVFDYDMKIIRANKSFSDLLAFSKTALTEQHFFEFAPIHEGTYECLTGERVEINEKFLDDAKTVMNRLREGQKIHNWKSYLIRKDGIMVPTEHTIVSLYNDDGNPTEFLAIIRDITEREKAEKEIKGGKEFLENVIDGSCDGIVITDEKGYIISANTALEKMCNFSKEELIGKHASIFTIEDKDTREKIFNKSAELLEKGFTFYEAKHRIGEEGSLDVECNISMIKDEGGNCIAGISVIRDITGRKKAEKEIKEAKDFLESIFMNSLNGIMTTDFQGFITMVNDAMIEILGYSRDELIGKNTFEFALNYQSVHQSGIDIIERLWDKGFVKGIERRWRKKNGTFVDLEMNMVLLKDTEGNLTGSVGSIRDITGQKKAEEALRESEKKYRKLVETANDAIFIAETETGIILDANKKAEDLLGVPIEEIIGMHQTHLFPKDDSDYYSDIFLDHVKKGQGVIDQTDIFVSHKNGMKIPVEISYSVTEIGGKEIVQGIFRNITARKKAEEALIESEKKYHILMETANDPIFIAETETGIIVDTNKKAAELIGVPVEEIIGMHQEQLHKKEDRDYFRKIFADQAQLKSGFITGDLYVCHKNGHKIPVEISTSVTEIEGKEIMQGIFRDITERKKAQAKIIEYQSRLKSLTSQLTLVEERNRRRFADYLHDQIGQKLFISKLKLEVLKESLSSTDNARLLSEIHGFIQQMISDTRSLTFDISPPVLYQLGIEAALEWLTGQMSKQYGIMVTFEDDKQKKSLNDDTKILLFQAVRELLSNVAKHAKTQNAKVSIQRDNVHVRICVEDDGVGFTPSDRTLDLHSEGGFGLFSIEERLDHLGGQFKIESRPGYGTEAVLLAPLHGESSA